MLCNFIRDLIIFSSGNIKCFFFFKWHSNIKQLFIGYLQISQKAILINVLVGANINNICLGIL